jgi:hypothetical protein
MIETLVPKNLVRSPDCLKFSIDFFIRVLRGTYIHSDECDVDESPTFLCFPDAVEKNIRVNQENCHRMI